MTALFGQSRHFALTECFDHAGDYISEHSVIPISAFGVHCYMIEGTVGVGTPSGTQSEAHASRPVGAAHPRYTVKKIVIISSIVLVVLLSIGVLVGMKMRNGKSGSGGGGGETAVRVEPVALGELVEIVSAPGQVQPKTKVQISARVAARIVEIPFDEGQAVSKGSATTKPSMLVKLDTTELEAQLRAVQARAAAQKAQVQESEAQIAAQDATIAASKVMLEDARRDLNRQKQLLKSKDVSQQIVDQAQAKVDQMERQLESSIKSIEAARIGLIVQQHQIEAAEAETVRARENLSYAIIYSPIDGIVTRLNAKYGEMVVMGTMNNAGTVIMEVSDLSEMQIEAQIDETNVASVKEGQKAKVRIAAFPDETFEGVVKNVGLDTAELRGQNFGGGGGGSMQGKWYKAKVVLDTKGKRIPAGLSADVDIETKKHTNVVRVPTQAVMGRPIDELPEAAKSKPEVDKNKTLATVVFKFEDGTAKVTPVTIDASDMTHTVVTSGIKAGEKIIIGPYKALPGMSDGMKVKDEKATTKPSATQSTTAPAIASVK